jgi:hypothetical protein
MERTKKTCRGGGERKDEMGVGRGEETKAKKKMK